MDPENKVVEPTKQLWNDEFEKAKEHDYFLRVNSLAYKDEELQNQTEKIENQEKEIVDKSDIIFQDTISLFLVKIQSKEQEIDPWNLVFKEYSQKESQKKNTNVAKFIIKIFKNNYQKVIKKKNYEVSQEYENFMKKQKQRLKELTSTKHTLDDLNILFGDKNQEYSKFQALNRILLYEIISSSEIMIKEIFKSPYIKEIKDKKQTLLASHIYRLRCYSKSLVKRIQTK